MIEEGTGYYAVPCSVKAIVISDDHVLLGLNDRGEWELPGGWPDKANTSIGDTAVREVREETGLHLDADRFTLVDAELFAPVPGRQVALIALATTVDRQLMPLRSAGHREITWHPVTELSQNLPDIYRRFITSGVDLDHGSVEVRQAKWCTFADSSTVKTSVSCSFVNLTAAPSSRPIPAGRSPLLMHSR